MNDQQNTLRDFMKSNYGDSKADKSTELNSGMSITGESNDELTNKLKGGITNNG